MKNSLKTLLLLPCLLAVPVSNFAPMSCSPRQAVAADNPTSPLTDIIVPRGPVALKGDATPFTKVLQDVASVETVNLKPTGEEAEVWVWEGQWGSESRAAFTQSAVEAALRTGGYTPKEIDSSETGGVILFNSFDLDDANLSFRPVLTSRDKYFIATNEERGSTVVGVWLQGQGRLALGLLPVELKARRKAAPLPGVGAGAVLVKDFNDTMASLPRPAMPKFPPLARKPRAVRGWLKDGAGRPVVGAEVSVHSSMGGGLRTTHTARSNAQGLYEVLVPTGIAEVVQVDKNVTYNGKKFNLELKPVSGQSKQFNSVDGHVENYLLRVEGKAGGTIRMTSDFDKGLVEIKLTPTGKMMDGGTGHTLIYRIDVAERIETYLNGVPLGRYKLSARLFEDDEELPLRVRRTGGSDAERSPKNEEIVDFQTEFMYIPGNTNQGAGYFEIAIGP